MSYKTPTAPPEPKLNPGDPIGQPMEGHQNWVLAVAYRPDGREIVSGSRDGTLRRWDARTGEQIGQPLTGHQSAVEAVAYSPDGREIVSGGEDNTLRRWAGNCINKPMELGAPGQSAPTPQMIGFDL